MISQFRTRIDGSRVRVIQTQAAINPGNSGGGLYDEEGMLGINTWTADKSMSEGIGFAIALEPSPIWPPPLAPRAKEPAAGRRRRIPPRRRGVPREQTHEHGSSAAAAGGLREAAGLRQRHPRLQLIQAEGTPPERYQLDIASAACETDDELAIVKSHMVEIALPLTYPRMPPQCRMLTPIFHPNIAPHAICIGDHWSPGEPLWSIVARIGEMIAYQSYNTKSPLNGEAARWVDQHVDELPLDPVSMMPDDATVDDGVTPRRPNPRRR